MPDDWEDPAVFERNRLAPSVPLTPYDDADAARAGAASRTDPGADPDSPYRRSLNGQWAFRLVDTPADLPGGFADPDHDTDGWERIPVPANWQPEGYGHAVYRNVTHEFVADPPETPEWAPVGAYRRAFSVPEGWDGRRVHVEFEGVKAAIRLYCNGEYVGYSQGSMTTAAFDLTPHLTDGENVLAAAVHRFCDGTYLEDQDMWRFSGIYRDVSLLARAPVGVRDVAVATDLREDHERATVSVEATVANDAGADAERAVTVDVHGPDGERVAGGTRSVRVPPGERTTATVEAALEGPALWSAERPRLYAAVVSTAPTPAGDGGDEPGTAGESGTVATRFGVRSVAVDDAGAIRVNGERVTLNGVNRHEHHPQRGRAVGAGWGRRELAAMKRANVNCVRCSHYPPRADLLDAADELGLYVVDEVNDEAHANTSLSGEPDWEAAYVDRAERMVGRDKNHPSVAVWSAGNESGSGGNIASVIEAGKAADPGWTAPPGTRAGPDAPGRPWLYGGNEEQLPFEDVVGPRYPTPEQLRAVAESDEDRPSFMDEYVGAPGNSMGGLEEYWDAIRSDPQLTGGAVWQWANHEYDRPCRVVTDGAVEGLLLGEPTLVDGRSGEAVSLSGHDDWVGYPRDPALDVTGAALTLQAWVRPGPYGDADPLVTKGDQYGLERTADALRFHVRAGAGDRSGEGADRYDAREGERAAVAAPVPDGWVGGWHHLAGVYDGETLRLYVDGEPVASAPHGGPVGTGYRPLNVGRDAAAHRMNHAGRISTATVDAVAVHARALDADAVRAAADAPPEETRAAMAPEGEARLVTTFAAVEERGRIDDFGIDPFTVNGITFSDGTAKPGVPAVRHAGRPVAADLAGDATDGVAVRLTNRRDFTGLGDCDATWRLLADGEAIREGELSVAVPPGASRVVDVPAGVPAPEPGVDYRLELAFALAADRPWADAGHVVAREGLDLPVGAPGPALEGTPTPVQSGTGDPPHRVDAAGYDAAVDAEGRLSLSVDGVDLLDRGPAVSVWHAPTQSETNVWGPAIAEEWRAFGLDRLDRVVDAVGVDGGDATVRTRLVGPGGEAFRCGLRYRFLEEDVLVGYRVETVAENPPSWLPRVGLQAALPGRFDRLSWYGHAGETYPDRTGGQRVGVHATAVDDYVPYVRPQTYGNHTGTRWAAVTDGATGLAVAAPEPTNVAVRVHESAALDRATRRPLLDRADGVVLDVADAVSGVGGSPVATLPEYRVRPGTFAATLRLAPLSGGRDPAALGRERLADAADGLVPDLD